MTVWTEEAWQDIPPAQGTYKMRRRGDEHWTKRPWLPVYIYFDVPPDPETGLPLDRSPRWQALIDGHPVEIHEAWPWAGKHPVTVAEYEALLNGENK